MNQRLIWGAAAAALALCAGPAAHAACKLQLLTTFPISFVNNQPMVDVSINGKPAHLRFTLGRSTFFWGSALKPYDLSPSADYATGYGAGGATKIASTRIHELKMGDFVQKDGTFYVGLDVAKADEAGIFGTGLFDKNDVELDFAHNAVRIFKPDGCKEDDFVYWGGAYSVIADGSNGYLPLKLAGKTLRGALDPGNEVTFVTLDGAHRAGVPLRAAGALPMGMLANGPIKPVDVSIAIFPEFVIGDETIKNAALAVGDIYLKNKEAELGSRVATDVVERPEIVLGGDFVKSHRIYIAGRKTMYFSYAGGPVFQDIYARLGAEAPMAPAQPPKP